MRIWRPTINSIHGFMGRAAPAAQAGPPRLTQIQRTMVAALGDSGSGRFIDIVRRIRAVEDLQALWYLRDDLMVALAAHHGEGKARDWMDQISHQFDGLLPRGLACRHSPLGRH